jgi:hypothetical protein
MLPVISTRLVPSIIGFKIPRSHPKMSRNATNVTIERNYVRRTFPVRHRDGGSGISVTRNCSNVRIFNNEVHEFGDRGVQLGGRNSRSIGSAGASRTSPTGPTGTATTSARR